MAPSTVLIVEDEVDIREALVDLLQDEGFEVAGVANGQEALERLRADSPPTVIVTDLMMPVMSGWELLQTLKGDEALRSIPIVVTSAALDVQLPAGVIVIKKPVRFDELLAHIRSALPTSGVEFLPDACAGSHAEPVAVVVGVASGTALSIQEPETSLAGAAGTAGVQEPPDTV